MSEIPAEPKLIVHHLANSRSQRILWLLEEIEAPYEMKFYERMPDKRAPKELLDIHPLGKSPVITHGDVTLAESGAIVEYIIRKFGNGKARPPASGEVHDLYFSHYAEGSLMPLVANKFIFSIVPGHSPFFVRPVVKPIMSMLDSQLIDPQLRRHVSLIENHLEKTGDWFAGGENPTSADFMMAYGVEGLAKFYPDVVGPKIKAWIERVQNRPAYKRASKKTGDESEM